VNSQIATSGSSAGNVGIGFAVPVDTVRSVLSSLQAGGRVERPWLGVHLVALDPGLRSLGMGEHGLLVQDVKPGGPAARAGIKGGSRAVPLVSGQVLLAGGDVVTAIDGVPVDTTADVERVLEGRSPGETVDVVVRRNGIPQTVRVELGNRPAGDGGDS
jgi:S1-C subfamily serine protease